MGQSSVRSGRGSKGGSKTDNATDGCSSLGIYLLEYTAGRFGRCLCPLLQGHSVPGWIQTLEPGPHHPKGKGRVEVSTDGWSVG